MKPSSVSGSKVGITIVVMRAALMAMIDISIVNVALTDIRASFGTPLDQIGWVSTGYMMANIVIIPMTGWFQRRFGFRRYFAGSIAAVHRRQRAVRPGLEPAVAGAVPRPAGHGRRRHHPDRAERSCSRATRARSTAWPARCSAWARSPVRCSARRIGGYLIDVVELALDLPGQRADRPASPRCWRWRFIEEPGFERRPRGRRSTATASRCSPSAWRRCSTCSRRATARAGSRAALIIVLAAVAAIALVTFIVHELETDAPGRRPARVREPQLHRRHRAQLPDRHRAVRRPYLFSLFCGAVMHYSALDIGRVFLLGSCDPAADHAPDRPVAGHARRSTLSSLSPSLESSTSLWMNAHLTASTRA